MTCVSQSCTNACSIMYTSERKLEGQVCTTHLLATEGFGSGAVGNLVPVLVLGNVQLVAANALAGLGALVVSKKNTVAMSPAVARTKGEASHLPALVLEGGDRALSEEGLVGVVGDL